MSKQPQYAKEEECNAYFEPKINPWDFPEVEVKTMEEEEEEVFKITSKMFRFDEDTKEWKERGFGDLRFMKHKKSGMIRVVMRRKQILKLCANHYIYPEMELKPVSGSERAFMYFTPADFADEWEEKTAETVCFRFKNKESAEEYKKNFLECQEGVKKIMGEKKTDGKVPEEEEEEEEVKKEEKVVPEETKEEEKKEEKKEEKDGEEEKKEE